MNKLTDDVENLTVAAVAQAVKIQRGHGASPTRIAQVADDVVATLTGGGIGPLEILEPIPLGLATATTHHPIEPPHQLDCAEV